MSHCHHDHDHDKYAVIRNQTSGLVLDASEHVLKIQHFTGFAAQLWKFENAAPGTFYIVNKGNGKVIDIEGGIKSGNNVITFCKNGGVTQQWFVNSDDTIVSAEGNLAIDIFEGKYPPGNKLIAHTRHGAINQQFHFQYQ
ncbi:hypothetical protein Zmor_002121 [Zophobas morio]|uniref:Ricin B lectin domain-containing protein n=1 Tax=Zophobas morio TaxID=2755281 RepID=A0AA38J924_9CUCU|nr:hypothetical protein Zmor_002121 [Zophobas morio]